MQTNTEDQILEAAKKVFVRKGFAGARMQEIANEASINKSMLHYYFRSKEQLFEKIMDTSIQLLAPQFLDAISGEGTVLEKIEKLVNRYIDNILLNPHIPLFVIHELSQGRTDFVDRFSSKLNMQEELQQFIVQIKSEQEAGIIRDFPPQHLILNVMSLIIFPFIARPIFSHFLKLPNEVYGQMMEERKHIVMDFIRQALLN